MAADMADSYEMELAGLRQEARELRGELAWMKEQHSLTFHDAAVNEAEANDLRAELRAAEAERERQQRMNMQTADAYSATKMAMLHDLTAATSLLQQAYEMLGSAAREPVRWLTERDALMAAIEAYRGDGDGRT